MNDLAWLRTLSACALIWLDAQVVVLAAPSGAGRCLADYRGRECELLTPELFQDAVPELQVVELEVEDSSAYGGGCTLSWPGERTKTINAGPVSMDLPVPNSVSFSQVLALEGDAADGFERRHRVPDDVTRERISAQTQKSLGQLEAEGELSQQQASIGRAFANAMMSNIRWEPVSDLGDRAAWGGVGNAPGLDVLVGNTQFSVAADVSDDETEDRAIAEALARKLIEACDG